MVKKDADGSGREVPCFFRCPISLEIMKSPVILSTGVTYDRSSILRWLDSGHNTCPVTMQVLHSKDIVPNLTLQRLIQIWPSGSFSHPDSDSDSPPRRSFTREQADDAIHQLKRNCGRNSVDSASLSRLLSFAGESDDNVRFLATNTDLLATMGAILGDESLVSSCRSSAEKIIRLYDLILRKNGDKELVAKQIVERNCSISLEILLKSGSAESRIATVSVLESICTDVKTKVLIAERNEILFALLSLVKSESKPDLIEAGLSCLICLSMPKRIRFKLIQLGAVNLLGKMLTESDLTATAVERTLKLLEMMSSSKEGRERICGDESCVPAIMKKVLKVSSEATERAVTMLWCFCCLFRDQKAVEAVGKSNGLAKILLLMQSNCSPAVRQMAGDLLKMFRVHSKYSLSSYDTKTTHIKPF